jgi:hypothetical protein
MRNVAGHRKPGIPEDHPVRATFLALTRRGLDQSDIHDPASVRYISNLMTEFLRTEDLYAFGDEPGPALAHITDLRSAAENCSDLDERKRYYKQLVSRQI